MTLSACAHSPAELPPSPSFLAPVQEPPIRAGEDARIVVGRYIIALDEANDRLDAGRQWYETVRETYGR